MKQIWYRKTQMVLIASLLFLLASCIDGFHDDETFSSGVTNTKLISPDSLSFTKSSNGKYLIVSWPVVLGAGGYSYTIYNVDDPSNPHVIGDSARVIDGCTVSSDTLSEETKYKIVVRTLGNTVSKNTEADSSTVGYYSTYIKSYATIPDGSDLYTYFQNNPVPTSTSTIAYDLVPNGHYTMSGTVSLGMTPIMLRGDKIYHSSVQMLSNSTFISDGAELTIQRINFDCSNSTAGLVTYNSTFNSSLYSSAYQGVIVTSPVIFKKCNVTGLTAPLIFDNGKQYALNSLSILDCVIGQSTTTQNLLFGTAGFIKDITFDKSTFYNTLTSTAGYLIQIKNSTYATKITGAGWTNGSITITNCTMWNICPAKKYINYSAWSNIANSYTLKKNIFVDCSDRTSGLKMSDPLNLTSTSIKYASYGYNTYWITSGTASTISGSYPGIPSAETATSTAYDNSGTSIQSDPQLVSPSTGDFTIQGADQIKYGTGDPRWWPSSK